MTSSLTRFEDFEQFGTKLFSQSSRQKDGKNVFLPPLSTALAMSMCTVGARHKTLQQMLYALEVLSIEQLTKITEQITRIFTLAYPDRKFQLKLANRLLCTEDI
jgi:serine protease inhibitor